MISPVFYGIIFATVPLPPPSEQFYIDQYERKIIRFTSTKEQFEGGFRIRSKAYIFSLAKDEQKFDLISEFPTRDIIAPRFVGILDGNRILVYRSWFDSYSNDWSRPAVWVLSTDGSTSCQISYQQLFKDHRSKNTDLYNLVEMSEVNLKNDIFTISNNLVSAQINSDCQFQLTSKPKANYKEVSEKNDFILFDSNMLWICIGFSVLGFILGFALRRRNMQ
jgi:hypothetical protein